MFSMDDVFPKYTSSAHQTSPGAEAAVFHTHHVPCCLRISQSLHYFHWSRCFSLDTLQFLST